MSQPVRTTSEYVHPGTPSREYTLPKAMIFCNKSIRRVIHNHMIYMRNIHATPAG